MGSDQARLRPQVCWYCQSCHQNLCENFDHVGGMRDGGAAEYVVVPERALLPVPDAIPDALATLTEPLACVLNGTNLAAARPAGTVLILGGGPIGLLYLLMMRVSGATVVVSEPAAHRAQSALDLGASAVLNPVSDDVAGELKKLTGRGADITIDTVGTLLKDAVASTRKGGRVLVFGLNDLARSEIAEADISYGELSIQGVYIANGTFPRALQLLEQNAFGFDRLITHEIPLEQFWNAVELSRSGDAIKAVVVPGPAE